MIPRVKSVRTRLAQHSASWAQWGSVTEGVKEKKVVGCWVSSYLLPHSFTLKIAAITDTFQGTVSGLSRTVKSDAIAWINPVPHTVLQWLPRSLQPEFHWTCPSPNLHLSTGKKLAGLPQGEGPWKTDNTVTPCMQDDQNSYIQAYGAMSWLLKLWRRKIQGSERK